MRKKTITLISTMVAFLFMSSAVDASGKTTIMEDTEIFINGSKVNSDSPPLNINDRLLVPIRVVSENLQSRVNWEGKTKSVTIITEQQDVLEMKVGNRTIQLNGRKYEMDVAPVMQNNRVYLPIRLAGEINHAEVTYRKGDVSLQKVPLHIVSSGETAYTIAKKYDITVEDLIARNGLADEHIIRTQQLKVVVPYVVKLETEKVTLLAKLIEAEARGESEKGKLAVGNVVINRVNSPSFPDSIKEVIYQKNQFAPVRTGKINKTLPSPSSIEAAKKAINGENVVGNALYFYNPAKTTSTFFNRLSFITQIDNHRFMR